MRLDIRSLAADYHVTSQLSVADIKALEQQGYRTIINARPDAETADQPTCAALRCAAGMTVIHVPVHPSGPTLDDVRAFVDALQGCERPVLGFCRTGKRAELLWQAAHLADSGYSERVYRK